MNTAPEDTHNSAIEDVKRAAMEDIAGEPTLAAAYELWNRKRGGRFAPAPADVDMLAFPSRMLPHLIIVDAIDGGERFRFRLVGSAVAAESGTDVTGKYVDEVLSGWMLEAVTDHYRAVVVQKRPGYSVSELHRDGLRSVRNRRLAMPLSTDGVSVDRLLLVFRVSSEWTIQEDLMDLAQQSEPNVVRLITIL